MMMNRLLFSAFLLTLFVSVSCTKNKKLGKDVIDENSYLNGITTDTFQLETYTIAEDSVVTSKPSNVVLGSYVDPKFGRVEASFYSQVRLASLNPNFGTESIKIDSFVLALKYAGYYGDLSEQTFGVYELNEKMYIDSSYYSFSEVATKSTNLIPAGKRTHVPKPTTNVVINGDTLLPQLRLHLDTNFARNIITEATNGSATFLSIDAFQAFFKGIFVRVENPTQSSGQGAIFYFDINNSASKLTVYFTQGGTQKTFDMVINSNCAEFSHVDIDNAGTPIAAILQDSTKGSKEFYAQAFKHRAIVRIKHIDQLPKNIVIHRADLTLPVQFQNGNRFKPGTGVSAATKLKFSDSKFTSLGVLGEFDDNKKHFSINLRTYVQALVKDQVVNYGVVVSPRYFINSSERIIFNGKETTNKNKPKLVLTYTTY